MILNQPSEGCRQSVAGPAPSPARRGGRIALAGLCALAILSGCAATRPASGGSKTGPVPAAAGTADPGMAAVGRPPPATGAARWSTPPPDLTMPPAARWRAPGDAPGPSQAGAGPAPVGPDDPAFTPFSRDLPDLRREVALICRSVRIGKKGEQLVPLVSDLYRSGVDPALATEALLQGDCGPAAAVVRELVAQGGHEVAGVVVERALSLGGPRAAPTIRAAAVAALEPAPVLLPPVYALAYFPSRGAERVVVTAPAPGALYRGATPGYGVYTFVLPGAAFNPAKAAERARYAELLRVIETYVLAGEQGTRGPRVDAHAFLVAVGSDSAGATSSDQTQRDLATAMRKDLARDLRRRQAPDLAERLERRAGPFLVSTLEPRLLPADAAAPRLVTDLSGIGPEYLYAVVDAYDRPVPPDQPGRVEGLGAIRDRLLAIFRRPAAGPDAGPGLMDAWVFPLGGPPAPTVAVPAPAPAPAPDAVAAPAATSTTTAAPDPVGATPSVSNPAPN